MNARLPSFHSVPVLLALIACSFPFAAGSTPVYWDPADGGNGHYYDAVDVTNGITWPEAVSAATAAGGHLCTITSAEENQFVATLIQMNPHLLIPVDDTTRGPWIGGFQPPGSPEPDGGWTWITGEPWSFTAWAAGEPNNSAGVENSLHFYCRPAGTLLTNWNDLDGGALLNGYVVEFEGVPATIRCSEVEISWPSFSHMTYRIEYQSSATSNLWATLPGANHVRGNGRLLQVRVKIPASQPEPVFRVMVGGTNRVDRAGSRPGSPGLWATPTLPRQTADDRPQRR